MQLIGKGVGVFLSEWLGAAGHFSTFADALHEVAHGEVLFDVFGGVECTSVVDGVGVLTDDPIRQRDVSGDDQVTGLTEGYDAVIGFVGSLIDDEVLDVLGGADRDLFVGDDVGGDCETFDAA